jgi:hypothetical protein
MKACQILATERLLLMNNLFVRGKDGDGDNVDSNFGYGTIVFS